MCRRDEKTDSCQVEITRKRQERTCSVDQSPTHFCLRLAPDGQCAQNSHPSLDLLHLIQETEAYPCLQTTLALLIYFVLGKQPLSKTTHDCALTS